MFSSTFFAPTYFASTYWAEGVAGPAPGAASGGGAVPVRGWDGRYYGRGNVETIYRPRETQLTPGPFVLRLKLSARLTSEGGAPGPKVAPTLDASDVSLAVAPARVKPRPRVTSLTPQPLRFTLSIDAELTAVPAEVTWHARLQAQLDTLGSKEQDLDAARALIARLQEEVIDLEDQLLLGVS